jgi:predicted lysophospholipase L1 biosynthesis ABC-type transport system permease subunit
MRSIRETYDLPREAPAPMRMWVVMVGFVILALVLWLVLPHSAVTVAILAVVLLAAVFTGVAGVMRSRMLSRPPQRRPAPPSAS